MAGYPMQGTLIAVEAFVRAVDNGADPGAWGVYQLVRSGDDMVVGDIGFHGPPNPGGSVTVDTAGPRGRAGLRDRGAAGGGRLGAGAAGGGGGRG